MEWLAEQAAIVISTSPPADAEVAEAGRAYELFKRLDGAVVERMNEAAPSLHELNSALKPYAGMAAPKAAPEAVASSPQPEPPAPVAAEPQSAAASEPETGAGEVATSGAAPEVDDKQGLLADHPLIALGREPISGSEPSGQNARMEANFEALEAELGKIEALTTDMPDWKTGCHAGECYFER